MISNNNNNPSDVSVNIDELPGSKKQQLTENKNTPKNSHPDPASKNNIATMTQEQQQQQDQPPPYAMDIDSVADEFIDNNKTTATNGLAGVGNITADQDHVFTHQQPVDPMADVIEHAEVEAELEDEDDDDVEDDNDDDDDDDDDDDEDVEEEVQIVGDRDIVKNTKRAYPLANEFDALAAKLMKPIVDYPVKDEAHYVWEIKDWHALLKEEKVRSPRFSCGGFEWNILLFPRGNNHNNQMSLYMEPHPPVDENDKPIDENWYVCAQFGLDIWNPEHPDAHLPSQSSHRFNKNETDWGFGGLIDVKQLSAVRTPRNQSTTHALLENNQLNITGFVKVIDDSSTGVLWHSFIDYDSKRNAGFVGLNNQGATCYLNSLLQSYFTTKLFRKLVYEIPTDLKSSDVALSLQRIFYLLTKSNDPVGTLELTRSFGWDSSDAFTQHDVQELNRILMDKLETAMKGSKIEGALNDIFVGKMKSYIKCVNVPYESSRVEDFWDIQLNVKGFKNLEQSFQNYIEIEMLEGENKYQAGDEYGYQDAKKGVVFESFPPVLHLQLKRFEYDFMVDDLVKIDDFYEFPDRIDLKPYLDEDLSDDVKNQNWNYKLHGVLVHQGSISNGHYYAMIKPNSKDNTWLRFDDDKVWKVTPTQVFRENFGAAEVTQAQLNQMTRAEQQEHMMRRVTSAYMLVYYRESELDKVLPADDSLIQESIPEHIPKQIEFEIAERERLEKERQEELYYTTAKLVTTSTINAHTGFDLALDRTVHKFYDEDLEGTACDPTVLKVRKDSKMSELIESIGQILGYDDTNLFRLVTVCHRNNHSNRLDAPVEKKMESATISDLYFKIFNRKYDEMVFYVEELNKDIRNINQLVDTEYVEPKDFTFEQVFSKIESVGTKIAEGMKFENTESYANHITIIVKYFDPISQEIRSLSHITVAKSDQIKTIINPVKQLLGFKDDVELDIYEELSPSKVDKVDPVLTFDKQELSHGDILTVQIANPGELNKEGLFKDLREYYKFLLTRLHINVRPFNAHLDEEDSDFVANDEDDIEQDDEPEDNEVTNEEIQRAKNLSKSFDFWISTSYSYQDLAKAIAAKLSCDPQYLRIFAISATGDRFALKSNSYVSQYVARSVPVSAIFDFEYEILNIPLAEYENLKAVKVHWLTTLLQSQVFEVLVPKLGTVGDVVAKLLHKVNVPKKDLPHLFLWGGKHHNYHEMYKADVPLSHVPDGIDLYCGLFPTEVELLCNFDLYKRFFPNEFKVEDIDEPDRDEFIAAKAADRQVNFLLAFHFYKAGDSRHGIPFVFIALPNEPLSETKERLRKKLGLGKQAFDKIRLALADNNFKGLYLEGKEDLVLYDEVAGKRLNLGLDHPDRSPKRQTQFDKGISIK
ncbi:Ubiquitin carboxyl-terminal hydrolase 15 [Candida viswanathii]|uniref:ubiquitinyl hydrolase 1 n=1 Tax=Candida viswanathii TaxID=5486 RepID=A0A367YMP8_9ASCO|nr:Ubiquitin carboxyl-terminal hydrolase 15 [Candida viswanathii]